MRTRRHFRGLRLDQRDKILLGLSAGLVLGGVYLAKFAPDPEALHGLYGSFGDVQSGGTVIAMHHPIKLIDRWRTLFGPRRIGI